MEDTREQWQELFERMWSSSGFRKLTESYIDLLFNPEVNAAWCDFMAAKIRSIVADPATAEKLIPKDSGYGGRRPPFGTGLLRGLQQPARRPGLPARDADPADHRDGHRDQPRGTASTTSSSGPPATTSAPAPSTGSASAAGTGCALEEHWADGPHTYLGIMTAGFPNFFFPGGPHGALGNNPRYAGDQVDYVMDVLLHAREHGHDVVEVDEAAEEQWTTMMNDSSKMSSFLDSSYFYGGEHPRQAGAAAAQPDRAADAAQDDGAGRRDRVPDAHLLRRCRSPPSDPPPTPPEDLLRRGLRG